ncbi:MAG: mechanosensitive ion channel family protein [Acidobacteriota bacterium]|jgi:small-conductance mechanosensitive channel|nr:mechanosensitive ion channel family protein [Acidobacteriota bacterium]
MKRRWKAVGWVLWAVFALSGAAAVGASSAPETPPAGPAAQTPGAEPSPEPPSTPPAAMAPGAPVAPFHQTIFSVYARYGPFSPEERADNLEQKIKQVNADPDFAPELMEIVPVGGYREIVYKDIVVMSVSDADADALQKTLDAAAAYYRDNIAAAVAQHQKETELLTVLTKAGLVLLILAAFYLIIKYVNKLFQFICGKVVALKGTVIKGVRIKSYDVLDEGRCVLVVLFLVRAVKYAFLLTVLYVSLMLLFSVFPETRGLAGKLLYNVLDPLSDIVIGVRDYIPKAIAIAVIVTVFTYLIKAIKYFAGEIERGRLVISGFYPDWAIPTYNIVRALLLAFMFVVIYNFLPYSDSDVFKGVSVFLGVIVSLGSTSLMGNLMSGLVMTYMRPFRAGDFVKIGDVTGTVHEKTPFAVRITTVKNEEVVIPNATVMSAYTTNYTYSVGGASADGVTGMDGGDGLILHATVTFGYDTPWRQVHDLLLDAARKTRYVLAEPPPFVLQNALGNFCVEYHINVYVREDKKILAIYSDLYANIQDAFKGAGLDMVCPTFENFRGETRITVTK